MRLQETRGGEAIKDFMQVSIRGGQEGLCESIGRIDHWEVPGLPENGREKRKRKILNANTPTTKCQEKKKRKKGSG